jgi:hypothetical protein
LDQQPFWFGNILYVFHMGENQFRAELTGGDEDPAAYKRFDEAVERLSAKDGGVISIYYHPTEFVHTEFWDAVNFSKGANPPRSQWKLPQRRTAEDSERCFHVLHAFVEHMKRNAGVRFVTAKDLPEIFEPALPSSLPNPQTIAEHLVNQITFLNAGGVTLSPADMLLRLLGLEPQVVDGPTTQGATTLREATLPTQTFESMKKDAADFIRRNHRLPSEIFAGAQTLSLEDFTATLAQAVLTTGADVRIIRGRRSFDRYISTEPAKSFGWVIHPEGFSAPELLEMARLQGWTLKPAKLRVPSSDRGSH